MKIQCPVCRRTTAGDAKFCPGCGTVLEGGNKRKNSLIVPLVIVAAVIFLCGLCGIAGLIGSREKHNSSDTNETKQTLVASASPAPVSLAQTAPTTSDKKNLTGKDTNQTAVVIAENVNLRESADSSSRVLETVPEGTTLQVVKQRGIWFLVHTGSQAGWVHGNTIRLEKDAPVIESKESSNFSEPPAEAIKDISPKKSIGGYDAPTVTKKSAPAVNPSGATARCGDGTLSYSAHRRGTCSHHGGVAQWF